MNENCLFCLSRPGKVALLRLRNTILILLGAFLSPPAMAQGNKDYYNPGTSTAERTFFAQVHSYHLQPGIEKMFRGQYQEAYQEFIFILVGFPNSPQALNMISELCANKWKSPKCEVDSVFNKAVARNPTIAETHVIYGIHLLRLGKSAEAVEKLNEALKLQPNSLNAHYNLGLAYFGLKQYELANRHAQASYALGAPLPGLRDKLVRIGKWQPSRQSGTDTPSIGNPSTEAGTGTPTAPN